jgi:hypothetical protein
MDANSGIKEQAMHLATPRSALSCFALLLLLATDAMAQGEEAAGVHFQHGDWEVACDNTLTCRIAGYCAAENHTGMCRRFRTGGAWHLPTFVARVVHEDGTLWNFPLNEPRQ